MELESGQIEDKPSKRISFRPSPISSWMQLVVGVLFLIFGIVFFIAISGEPESWIGQAFLILWMLVVSVLIFYSIYNLRTFKGSSVKPTSLAVIDIEQGSIEDKIAAEATEFDFDAKLRKLESLKKDGLLSEDEYQKKRTEILGQKW